MDVRAEKLQGNSYIRNDADLKLRMIAGVQRGENYSRNV